MANEFVVKNGLVTPNVQVSGSTSGTTTVSASATASGTLTLPAATDTLVGKATTDTLTNKSISGASNTLTNIPNSALTNSTISGVSLGSNLNALTIGTGLSGTSYNGSSAVTIALANTAVTAGSYGSGTAIPVITVDAQGRITAASTSAITEADTLATVTGRGATTSTASTFSGGLTASGATAITLSNASANTITTGNDVNFFINTRASTSATANLQLRTGDASGTLTAAGFVSIYAGQGTTATGATVSITGGNVNLATSTGGSVTIQGGTALTGASTAGTGGAVYIYGGYAYASAGTKVGGSVYLEGGAPFNAGTNTNGTVYVGTNAGGSNTGTAAVNIGSSAIITTVSGTVKLPNVGTSGFVKLGAGGQLSADTNTYLTGNQSISITGDATGSGTTSIALTLATVNSNVGTFNNVTVNAKGLVTAASNIAYLTSESDTLATVTGRGASTSTASTFSGGLTVSSAFTQSGGFAYIGNYNIGPSQSRGLPATNNGVSFTWNLSDGSAESNIWNTGNPSTYSGTGLRFLQWLTTTTYRDLMFLRQDGALSFGGVGNIGSSGQVLQSNGAGAPTWVNLPTIGNGTFGVSIGTAGATNTTVTWGTSSGFSANTGSNYTYDLKVGPALTNLAALMTTAGAGFIRRGATADTYTIDTNTYLTAESDTLASVTGRGASTSTESIFTGNLRARKSQTAGDYTTAALWTESFSTTATGIAFHISGTVGKFLEMRTNGILYWNGDTVWTSGNLTNLNQLTNGPGYITGESDTLATVTGRGATTSSTVSFTGASKLGIQGANDGSSNYGIFLWQTTDTNWGIYMSTSGSSKSLANGTAPASIDGRASHHVRFRAGQGSGNGFIWESAQNETTVMSLATDTGSLYVKGAYYVGGSTSTYMTRNSTTGALEFYV